LKEEFSWRPSLIRQKLDGKIVSAEWKAKAKKSVSPSARKGLFRTNITEKKGSGGISLSFLQRGVSSQKSVSSPVSLPP
jgi:hypothetical protein